MGRDRKNENRAEHFAKMVRTTMQTSAWQALSTAAQALYPWLKLEWRGPRTNNNGKIRLSYKQAAEALGVNVKTAANAFRDLQAKGFIVVTEGARLGLGGSAIGPAYEITEIPMPIEQGNTGRKLFLTWQVGRDFVVHRAVAQNPRGINGRAEPRKMTVVK